MESNDEFGERFEREFDDYISSIGGCSQPITAIAANGQRGRSADRLVQLHGHEFAAELKALYFEAYILEAQRVFEDLSARMTGVDLPYRFKIQLIVRRGGIPQLRGQTLGEYWTPQRLRRFAAAAKRELRSRCGARAIRVLALFSSARDFELEVDETNYSSGASDRGSLQVVAILDRKLQTLKAATRWHFELSPEVHRDESAARLRTLLGPASKQLRQTLQSLGRDVPALIIARSYPDLDIRTVKDACHGPSIIQFPVREGILDLSRGVSTHHWHKGFILQERGDQEGREHISAVVTLQHLTNGVGLALHNPTARTPCPPVLIELFGPRVEQFAWVTCRQHATSTIEGLKMIANGKVEGLAPWHRRCQQQHT